MKITFFLRKGFMREKKTRGVDGWWCICQRVRGGGGEGGFLWWICPGVKFTRLACVEIREAYLFKESTETMQIEGQAREGRGALYVHLVQSEGGGRRRGERKEEKGAKRRQWKRGWAKWGEKVSEGRTFVCQQLRYLKYQTRLKILTQAWDHVIRIVAGR